jgi:hypothetical protein
VGVHGVSDVDAADVKVSETASDGDHAEDEADEEADEEEGFHGFLFGAWLREFFASRLGGVGGDRLGLENLKEAID